MKHHILFTLLTLFTLSACSVGGTSSNVISECFPSHDVFAWEDSNGNGQVDDGEQPLAGVPVAMINARTGSSQNTSSGATDNDGKITLHGIGDFGETCDEIIIEVTVPSDYLPTTPTNIDLSGLPRNEVIQFGLISQFPTPLAEGIDGLNNADFLEACTLFTPHEAASILGITLEFELISGSAIGENGMMTHDCMTNPAEPNLFMYSAFAIEDTAERAAEFFHEDIEFLASPPTPIKDLGDSAYFYVREEGAPLNFYILQDKVYLLITISFFAEPSAEDQTRAIEFAKFYLERILEKATP